MTTFAHFSAVDAESALESILPATAVAEPILRAFAGAIEVVAEVGPKMWAVTLGKDVVRLNFGPVEVFLIFRDSAWFPVSRTRKRYSAVERSPAPHVRLAGADRLAGAHWPVAEAFDSARASFRAAMEAVRAQYRRDDHLNAAAKKAHARGLLDYLEARLHVRLPRPAWDDVVAPPDAQPAESELPEVLGMEGGSRLRTHLFLERASSRAIRQVKERWRLRDPLLRCEVCGFSAELVYGHSYTEAHHRVPLHRLEGPTLTLHADLACVCANCHCALHADEGTTVEELRQRVRTEH